MDQFLTSCGGHESLRLDVVGPSPQQAVRCVYNQPYILVGRESGNDLRLDHEHVSRRHAYLQMIGGRIFCVDMGSRTGLHWSEAACVSGWLTTPMKIGPYTLMPLESDAAATPQISVTDESPLDAAPPAGTPIATLEFILPSGATTRHTLDHTLTLLGRSNACRLQIANLSLSRHHCAFLYTPKGIWVVDLLSREGVTIDGRRVRYAPVRPGEKLTLGQVLVRAHFEEAPTPSRSAAGSDWRVPEVNQTTPPSDAELSLPPENGRTKTSIGRSMGMSRPPTPQPFDLQALEKVSPEGALLVPVLQQMGFMQQQMMEQFHQSMQMMVQMFATLHREQASRVQEELEQIRLLTKELNELQASIKATPAPPTPQSAPALPVRSPSPSSSPSPTASATPSAPFKLPSLPPTAKSVGDMHQQLSRRILDLERERMTRWEKLLAFVSGK